MTTVRIGLVQYKSKKPVPGKGAGFTIFGTTTKEILPLIVADLEARGYRTSYNPNAPKDRAGRRNAQLSSEWKSPHK